MGYYTSFRLSSTLPAAAKETVLQAFEQNDCYVDLSGNDTYKWYEWMEDCLKVSASLPGVLFKIVGVGEESDDLWWVDFLNGQVIDKWFNREEPFTFSPKALETFAKQPLTLSQKWTRLFEYCASKNLPEKTIRAHILPASWSQYHEDTEEGLEAAITYITCNTNFTREELSALWPNK